jgi:site-specific DNA-cytosine methylase
MELAHGSLFSGRGTWDIVAQELGFENKFNCEIDPFLRGKLRRIVEYIFKCTLTDLQNIN